MNKCIAPESPLPCSTQYSSDVHIQVRQAKEKEDAGERGCTNWKEANEKMKKEVIMCVYIAQFIRDAVNVVPRIALVKYVSLQCIILLCIYSI